MDDEPMQIERTDDRWERVAGSRFVTAEEYVPALDRLRVTRGLRMVDVLLAEALARAADDQGVLTDLRVDEFWPVWMTAVLRDDEFDPASWRLDYDRFAATYVIEAMHALVSAGLLAHRGNGDSHDERLTLPADA